MSEARNNAMNTPLVKIQVRKMNKKTVFFLLATCLLVGKISIAQNAPESLTNTFFEIYKKDNCEKALDYLFSTNKYSSSSRDAIDNLKHKLKAVVDIDGNYYGYDLVFKKAAGPNFVMFTYLVKYDRDPLTFRILLYRVHDTWKLQNFKFDNKMDDELEEASKAVKF